MPAEPKLHHVGIILRNEAQAAALLSILGLQESHRQYIPEYEAECIFTAGSESRLELIVPRGGKLAKFNQGFGGLHHIAMEVEDLAAVSARLKALGIQLLEQAPVRAGDLLINFLPPVYTRGVIVEFVQRIGTGTQE